MGSLLTHAELQRKSERQREGEKAGGAPVRAYAAYPAVFCNGPSQQSQTKLEATGDLGVGRVVVQGSAPVFAFECRPGLGLMVLGLEFQAHVATFMILGFRVWGTGVWGIW